MIADTLFAPVVSTTAFEETLERLSVAIKLRLLEPGAQLPPERELCEQLGIARSTLRQALTALVQSGHLVALRGRAGGTFVADCPPAPEARPESLLSWRDTCDTRVAVELGVAVLAAERAAPADAERLDRLVAAMARDVEDFAAYRQADVLFHIGLAEATGSGALVAAMTDSQGAMTDLFAHIAHPPEVLAWANGQHARLVECLRRHDTADAVRIMQDHLRGTEHVLAGLLP